MVCDKSFSSTTAAYRHTHEHSSRHIPCPHCPRAFKGRYQWDRHIHSAHIGDISRHFDISLNDGWNEAKKDEKEKLNSDPRILSPSKGEKDILKCPACQHMFPDDQEDAYEEHIRQHYQKGKVSGTKVNICNRMKFRAFVEMVLRSSR